MRIRNAWFAVLAVAVLVLFCAVSSNAASQKEVFAAKVNGVGIKTTTLDAAVNNFVENQKMYGTTVKDEEKTQLKENIMTRIKTRDGGDQGVFLDYLAPNTGVTQATTASSVAVTLATIAATDIVFTH